MDPEAQRLMLDKEIYVVVVREQPLLMVFYIIWNRRKFSIYGKKDKSTYIDETRTFEVNLAAIQARESIEFTTNDDTAARPLTPSLRNRIIGDDIRDGISYTNIRFNDVELCKLSMCSKFIFSDDDIPMVTKSDKENEDKKNKTHDMDTRSVIM